MADSNFFIRRPWLDERPSVPAERAGLGFIGGDFQGEQASDRFSLDQDLARCPVDEHVRPDDIDVKLFQAIDDFVDRAAGRQDIFDDDRFRPFQPAEPSRTAIFSSTRWVKANFFPSLSAARKPMAIAP